MRSNMVAGVSIGIYNINFMSIISTRLIQLFWDENIMLVDFNKSTNVSNNEHTYTLLNVT